MRFRDTGSAGGHYGIKSLIESFGSEVFERVKIGVGRDERIPADRWVLSNFPKDELEMLRTKVFPRVQEVVEERIISHQ